MSNFRNRRLVTDSEAARRHAIKVRLLRSAVSLIVVFLFAGFVAVSLYKRFGSLTVSINRFNSTEYSLILYEHYSDIETGHGGAATIASKEIPDITNISGDTLPLDVDEVDGQHNGENYYAYTFYLVNNGANTLNFEYTLTIDNVTLNVDRAIRIRLYEDGTPTTYARTRTDGGGAEVDDYAQSVTPEVVDGKLTTTPFYDVKTVMRGEKEGFAPGEYHKYTIVIWLEGGDPDCVDDIIGGEIKCSMNFSVLSGT